jgi:hypothetical protein
MKVSLVGGLFNQHFIFQFLIVNLAHTLIMPIAYKLCRYIINKERKRKRIFNIFFNTFLLFH